MPPNKLPLGSRISPQSPLENRIHHRKWNFTETFFNFFFIPITPLNLQKYQRKT